MVNNKGVSNMLNYYLNPWKKSNVEKMFWDDFFAPVSAVKGMKTDVTETDSEYLFDVELPGYNKEDVKISVDEGYLTIEAVRNSEKESNEKNYISRERYSGRQSRSWYIGNVDEQQIKASFDNGILKVSVPKEQLPEKDTRNYITID